MPDRHDIGGVGTEESVRRTEKEFVGARKGFTTPEQTPTISLVSHPQNTEAKTPLIREESEQDRQLQDGDEPASGGGG